MTFCKFECLKHFRIHIKDKNNNHFNLSQTMTLSHYVRYFSVSLLCGVATVQSASAFEINAKLSGRAQLDYNQASADLGGGEWDEAEFRRGRAALTGNLLPRWKYKVEVELNGIDQGNLTDAWVQWTPKHEEFNIKIGQFKTANSLDELTSSRFISTLERSAYSDTFEFRRRMGVAITRNRDKYTVNAGAFIDSTSDRTDQGGYAIAVRGTYLPLKTEDALMHVGGSFRYRNAKGEDELIRYRQRPYTHVAGRIISTGKIADSDLFFGGEAAGLWKGAWVAGEYGLTFASCPVCDSDPNFSGGYMEAGMFFGGRKVYKKGKFDRPKVDRPFFDDGHFKGGFGALSLVGRLDTVSLVDKGTINGGDYDAIVLGADWYPADWMRFGVNYFKVDSDIGDSTSGLDSTFASLVGTGAEVKVDGFVARAQFDF